MGEHDEAPCGIALAEAQKYSAERGIAENTVPTEDARDGTAFQDAVRKSTEKPKVAWNIVSDEAANMSSESVSTQQDVSSVVHDADEGNMPIWVVVGGVDKGGIIVREGKDLNSAERARLQTGATVREVEKAGNRLYFRKVTGEGPDDGWVNIKLKDKALLTPA